jgi:hypothetical protein
MTEMHRVGKNIIYKIEVIIGRIFGIQSYNKFLKCEKHTKF